MSVEQVTYINDLEPARPQGGDSIAQGDDHIRNIKKAIKQTFPNIDGEVLATSEELNNLVGIDEKVADVEQKVEEAFDDDGNIIANGLISTDNDVGIVFEDNGSYQGLYPVDANGDYKEASLGDEATPWRAGWFAGSVHSPAYFTDPVGDKYYLTMYSRSMWGDGGHGLYFSDSGIMPGNDAAGTTDGVTSLGAWGGASGLRFRNVCISGSVLGRSAFSSDMSVGLTMADVITAFERVKESVNRANTVEEMRSSIVDSFGGLIEQMKQRQQEILDEVAAEAEVEE